MPKSESTHLSLSPFWAAELLEKNCVRMLQKSLQILVSLLSWNVTASPGPSVSMSNFFLTSQSLSPPSSLVTIWISPLAYGTDKTLFPPKADPAVCVSDHTHPWLPWCPVSYLFSHISLGWKGCLQGAFKNSPIFTKHFTKHSVLYY